MDKNNSTLAAGPGAVVESGIAPDPLLQGATEYEVVTIFNPLPVNFVGMVGQSKPVSMPFEIRKDGVTQTISNDENAVRQNYGLNLKNPDHPARMPIVNRVVIPAGETRRLLGNEAQVVVRQLVNEIMQRQGKSLMLADPTARNEVEQTVVRSRSSVEDVIGNPRSVQSQIREGVDKLNEEVNHEEEFAGLNATSGQDNGSTASSGQTASTTSRNKSSK